MATQSDLLILVSASLLALSVGHYLFFLGRTLYYLRSSDLGPVAATFPSVSIVIPARNEAEHIRDLLLDIDRQSAPVDRIDVVVVDDHSEDGTVEIVMNHIAAGTRFPVRLILLENTHSKKAALSAAVSSVSSDWIVTVDADVRIPDEQWLSGLMKYAAIDKWMICGPVLMDGKGLGMMAHIASLESLGLLSIAASHIRAGRPLFCNGANLAFRRDKFLESGGYDNGKLSGDDTDLLYRFPSTSICFADLPRTMVTTRAVTGIREFVSQRQRWASKIPRRLAARLLLTGLSAWTVHAGLTALTVAATFCLVDFRVPLALAVLKSIMEHRVLNTSARRFGKKVIWPVTLLLQPLYCLAISFIGVMAVAVPYRWKGRSD